MRSVVFDLVLNAIMVSKKDGRWCVCVDYINLNKACPKDCYLIPKIDQMVDVMLVMSLSHS